MNTLEIIIIVVVVVLAAFAIGEKLDCDCKTVDNALQRVKRKVGAHLTSRNVVL